MAVTLLMTAVLILAATWAALVPPWQVPDENSHFAYAQGLAERGERPKSDLRSSLYSSEHRLATDRANAEQTAFNIATKPEWSRAAFERWQRDEAALPPGGRASGLGPNPAELNPPLYYAYASVPYLAATSGTIFDRLYLMRLWSALLLVVTVGATWRLAGEVFGADPVRRLAAAGVAGLQPMVTFITAGVHPDGMLIALWSVVLWLGAAVIRRGPSPGRSAALVVATALAVATKPVSVALVPAVLLALAVGLRRRRGRTRESPLVLALACAGALAAMAVAALVALRLRGAPVDPRLTASYLWQFYLPALPGQKQFSGFMGLPVYEVWLKTSWAAFGWFEVRFSEPVYLALAVVTAGVIAAALGAAWRHRARLDGAVVAFCALAGLTLLLFLHAAEAASLTRGNGAISQGRYLLPLVSLGGLALAGALTLLPPARRVLGLAAALGGLVVLQVASLALVLGRFYA